MFRRSRTVLLTSIAVSAATAVTTAALTASPAAAASPATQATPSTATSSTKNDAVQRVLDQAVSEGGAPGIIAEVQDGNADWFGSAGVADTATGRRQQPLDRYRIGSMTKSFTSTVLLQMVGEGRLSLNDTVEKWLPGVVKGNGHDGSKITVRQLLNHTSGIFNYTNDQQMLDKLTGPAYLKHRFDAYQPEQLVQVAMTHAPDFAPGTSWAYSNTNYILAGMIARKVSGRPLADEVTRRIIVPLGLTSTYVAGQTTSIFGPHGKAYSKLELPDPAAPVYDVSDMNPSWAGTAGDMVSTSGDINRFYTALLRGRLLAPAQQKEMFTAVPTVNWIPNTGYGLGLITQKLPCGVQVWGHGGTIHGSLSWSMGLRDGSKMASTAINGDWVDQGGISNNVMQAAFCPASTPTSTSSAKQTSAPSAVRPSQLF
ncbi:beta-lactamase family protein [Actinomadura barringtoniae]|uniref:Beta-lactamase family protein n=1 Tax=Actinomadura barringtoniae TaxID=1427535 RepID=A0A939T382_9ACTN|nr:serine hydrolase domain-containing protein [Actinomadura barringtoniae]MBO2447728.1 beta-lactamase family protein [Actinomadura barringtoniae]